MAASHALDSDPLPVWSDSAPHRAAKRERLDDEYRKAVEAMRPKIGRPKMVEETPQIIVEINRSERETDHKLAKANGTNRTRMLGVVS